MLDLFFSVNYWLTVRVFKNKDFPVFSTIIIVTFYQIFSLLFVFDFFVFQVLDRRDVIFERNKIIGFLIITIVLIFNYIYFKYENRYSKILDNYKKLDNKHIYNVVSILYMILVLVLNVYSVYSIKNNIKWF